MSCLREAKPVENRLSGRASASVRVGVTMEKLEVTLFCANAPFTMVVF